MLVFLTEAAHIPNMYVHVIFLDRHLAYDCHLCQMNVNMRFFFQIICMAPRALCALLKPALRARGYLFTYPVRNMSAKTHVSPE